VHLGTAQVIARASQNGPIAPGERGRVRLVLEAPLVMRGGDQFVLRSLSPVTTIGGGGVLDPFPSSRPRLAERRLELTQDPADRLAAWVAEAGLAGLRVSELPVRLGIPPGENVSAVIAAAGKGVLSCDGLAVWRVTAVAEAERMATLVAGHHEKHPLDPGMSLQALRSSLGSDRKRRQVVPEPVMDLVIDLGCRKQLFEVEGGVVRRPGWVPTLDLGTSDARSALVRRLTESRWQVPTVIELEREFSGAPVRALLAHLVREGGVEQVDQERFASPEALAEFRSALQAELGKLGSGTPAELRDRFGLTRKYLIPLLEWADRQGVTERRGDARVLARLTGRSHGA
ncbi:MAG: SelB C-terminal domain-containing protein, partial [bacterium]